MQHYFIIFLLSGKKGTISILPGSSFVSTHREEYWRATDNDTVTIPCLAKGWSPFANISWHFRNEAGIQRIIKENATSTAILTGQGAWRNAQADPTKPELVLVIPKFQKDHHIGHYICRAENAVGFLEREILLAPSGELS